MHKTRTSDKKRCRNQKQYFKFLKIYSSDICDIWFDICDISSDICKISLDICAQGGENEADLCSRLQPEGWEIAFHLIYNWESFLVF